VHLNLGRELHWAHKYSEAEQEYREAIRLNPKLAPAYEGLAQLLLYGKAAYAEAETVYRDQLRLTPKNLYALMGLATSLDKQGRRSEARPVWKKALRRTKGGEPVYVIKKRLAEPD
jgi:cytochrome c-type biogenesis protein CcmH/NrfG